MLDIIHCFTSLYADDTKIYRNINTIDDCMSMLKTLTNMHTWTRHNNIRFNASKCKALTITRKKSPLDFIYKLDNLELERVSTEKVVVVNITNSLTWNTHIHSITAKAYKLLGFLKHTCPLLNDFSAKHILSLYLVNCTILPLPSLVWRLLVDHVLIIICTMGGASHGSSRPVRTFPFDLITLNHFAHISHFFSWLFNLLYVICVMVNKAVKKKKKKR